MAATRFHIYVIGILLLNFYAYRIRAETVPMVEVEPSNIVTKSVDGNYSLLPYRERRPTWGKTFSVDYSTYTPTKYTPNFLEAGFDDVYSTPEVPLIELNFTIKYNSRSVTIGGELGVGVYQISSGDKRLVDSTLQLFPIKVGMIAMLDALAPTPHFVPYVAGGGYTMIYKENNNSTSFNGNTQFAPYVHAGVATSLDWIDKRAARISYEDSGIEATYAFIEAQSLFEGQADKDPDFSSPISFAGGIKVEF